jgi:glycerol-3-phosphate dehydrogenase
MLKVIYYDGQMNDSRMNVSIAITASMKGAAIANHVEVLELLREGEKIVGAKVRDTITGNALWKNLLIGQENSGM